MPFSFIIGCAQFIHQFDGLVIAMALPSMAQSLHVTPIRLELAITCYLLSLAVFVPLRGWLADTYGTKKIYLLAICIFTLSSLFCGLSESFSELVLWRTIPAALAPLLGPLIGGLTATYFSW